MQEKYCVLDDSLLSLFREFEGKDLASQTTSQPEKLIKLLKLYHPHLTNVAQMKRMGIGDSALLGALASNGLGNQTLEELAIDKTIFKVVFTDDSNSNFPYSCINNDDAIKSSLSFYFKPGESRNSFLDYLRIILDSASYVVIYDKYFLESGPWNNTRQIFNLFPNKRVPVILPNGLQLNTSQRQYVSSINNRLVFSQDSRNCYAHCHDRYIRVGDKIEIMLSSGIDYIFDKSKDLNVIIREFG